MTGIKGGGRVRWAVEVKYLRTEEREGRWGVYLVRPSGTMP